MREIELKVFDLSTTIQPVDAYALVLQEVGGVRKLPVIIGSLEAQSIRAQIQGCTAARPSTHDLMLTMLTELEARAKKVVIYKVKEGVYYSYLYLVHHETEHRIDCRTSDAIALALRQPCPIYVVEDVLDKNYMVDECEGRMAVSVNLVSLPGVRQALETAIRDEDYELAAKLRDEIRRREQEQQGQQPNK
jgi:hypothetical protein